MQLNINNRSTDQPPAQSVLVVGGDSVIGSALVQALTIAGYIVTATTRHETQTCGTRLHLDLTEPGTFEKFRTYRFDTAVLCGAITSVEKCEQSPSQTRKVNVDGTLALAQLLGDLGTHLVFLSTNMVFDGSKPFPKAGDPTSPTTEYGRQKVAVENSLLGSLPSLAVVRFTKIIQPRHPLLVEWITKLRAGYQIHPYLDRNVSPLSLSFTIELLLRVIKTAFCGVVHASAAGEMSYADVGFMIAKEVNICDKLVQPLNSQIVSDDKSKLIYVAMESGVEIFGLYPPQPCTAIADFLKVQKLHINTD